MFFLYLIISRQIQALQYRYKQFLKLFLFLLHDVFISGDLFFVQFFCIDPFQMVRSLLCLEDDLPVFRTDQKQLQRIFFLQDAARRDPEGIVDRIIGDRSDDDVCFRVPVFLERAVPIDVFEPFPVSLERKDVQIFCIQFIPIDVGLFPFSSFCPALRKSNIITQIKTLRKISVLSSVTDIIDTSSPY